MIRPMPAVSRSAEGRSDSPAAGGKPIPSVLSSRVNISSSATGRTVGQLQFSRHGPISTNDSGIDGLAQRLDKHAAEA